MIKEQISESDDKKFKKLHLNFGIRLVLDRISLNKLFKNVKITVTIEENTTLLNSGYEYSIIQDKVESNDLDKIQIN